MAGLPAGLGAYLAFAGGLGGPQAGLGAMDTALRFRESSDERRRKEEEEAKRAALIQSLPREMQTWAQLAPGATAKAALTAQKRSRPMAVSPGQTVIDPDTGGVMFQAPGKKKGPSKPYTEIGQVNEDLRTGRITKAQADALRSKLMQGEQDAFSTEFARILQANPELGQSEEGVRRAQNIALGLVRPTVDPQRGGTAIYNLATAEGEPLKLPKPEVQRIGGARQGPAIEQMAQEVGAAAVAEDILGRTIGQVPMFAGIVSPERTEAETSLDFLKQRVISAFSLSERPPVIEQQRLAGMLPSKGFWESPQRAIYQLGTVRDLLARTHDTYADWVEGGSLPAKQENELRAKMAEIQALHQVLPAPEHIARVRQAEQGGAQAGQQPRQQQPEAPGGLTIDRVQQMGLDELSQIDPSTIRDRALLEALAERADQLGMR